MKVFVTGVGVVSALGNNTQENLSRLLAMQTGISKKSYPDLNREIFTGEVNLTNQEIANVVETKSSYSRTSLLGMLAAKECWGSNIFSDEIRTGFISGTSVGGMDSSEGFFRNKLSDQPDDIFKLLYHDSGDTTARIAKKIGISGYVNTLSTACSSGSNAILHGARLIQSGRLDRLIVGGSDAMTEFTLSGFKSLMIYSDDFCMPFDQDRTGLNLGEGAAYLLLESEETQKITQNKILAEIKGGSNTADAYHQTATSPNAHGATLAIKNALKKAGINPSEVDYVNAHGTSTPNNDLTESVALKNVFGDSVPPFSSTKSYTGHTLAASGAIEAVYSVLAINNGILFPNLHFNKKIEETGLVPVQKIKQDAKIHHIVSNSFGFGGNCTSLVISKA